MLESQAPILIIVLPLLGSFFTGLVGLINNKYCLPIAWASLAGAFLSACYTLVLVVNGSVLHYQLAGWPPPVGIEYVIDPLNAVLLVLCVFVALIVITSSARSVEQEFSDRLPAFYSVFLLLVTGMLGMTITGDLFNLYVLLEISSLATYALIGLGRGEAYFAAFRYLIIGTVGASFYLLGTGYLYIKTGTLNMADLQLILPDLYGSQTVRVGFLLILLGVWIKMAFFPLHGWLPNAYTQAPSAVSAVVAPLATKVSVYIMLRVMLSVVSIEYVYQVLPWKEVIVFLASIAIVGGSLFALAQRNLKRLFSYLIVAEVGYMVGGAWLGNQNGLVGASFHIFADMLITLSLFSFAAIVIYKTKGCEFENMRGMFAKMPWTMGAFALVALSIIGVPPTCGFFSKWYLISGAIQAGAWVFAICLLASSLVNAIIFFRLIEVAYYPQENEGHVEHVVVAVDEAPGEMVTLLWVVALTLVLLGLFSAAVVSRIILPTLALAGI